MSSKTESRAWCVKILAGRLAAWREFNETLQNERRAEADDQRVRMGFVRHYQSLQARADGYYVVNFAEARDFAAGFRILAESNLPFDLWFKQHVFDVYGSTPQLLAGAPQADTLVDWTSST
jgi:hypothetical protein